VLEQKSLAVVVKKQTIGEIETNVDEILAFIESRVKDYAIDKYSGDSDSAKKDRAELNKAEKRMAETGKELTDMMMLPLAPTLEKIKQGRTLIAQASKAVDALVKAKEAEEDEVKKSIITQYWTSKEFTLVPLDHPKIWDARWLNKGTTIKEVKADIDEKINRVYSSIKTLEAFGQDVETLKAIFIETLDLGAALDQGARLQKNRERLAEEAAARPEREHTEAIRTQQVELAKEEVKLQNEAPVISLAAQAAGVVNDPYAEILTYTMEFTGTRAAMFDLRQYMTDNGITYRKIEATA